MKGKRKFSKKILNTIRTTKIIHIRAGTQPHRFIRIWAVVVQDRVFLRSWSLKRLSWYKTFLIEPTGSMEVDGRKIAVHASQTRSKKLLDAIDRAYLDKYNTKASIRYTRDLCRPRSRATTTELIPL